MNEADKVHRVLSELKDKMEQGEVLQIVRRDSYGKTTAVQVKEGSSLIPAFKGSLRDVKFNIDFAPYPEGGYLEYIEGGVDCPFKLVLTLENTEIKSLKYKPGSAYPVQEIEIGVKEFDDRYFIETLEEEPVRQFLSHEETRNLIFQLGDIDRLAFQYKYVKMTKYTKNVEEITSDSLFRDVDILSHLAQKLSELKKA